MNARLAVFVLTVLGSLVALAGIGDSQEKPSSGRSARVGLELFSSPEVLLDGNRVECGIANNGSICANVPGSGPAYGGGWPLGTPDRYIFASGLQIAGIVAEQGGPWAGDTVGAWFYDPSGIRPSSEGRTPIHVSTDPEPWPDEARIPDNGVYDPALVGREAISEQDSWVQYWDGSPDRVTDRVHPIGIEITQRTHAWNWPYGNQDVLYFVFDVENVTAEQEFQGPNELEFFAGENALPDDGWPIDEVYVGYYADHDVTDDARSNFTTAVFPFDLVLSYQGGFDAPAFDYPSHEFHPPFFVDAPGFVGAALVGTPGDGRSGQGLTLATGYLGAGPPGYPISNTAAQLWNTLSGKGLPYHGVPAEVETGDPVTTERSTGLVYQDAHDARVTAATGPFRLEAGERTTIVLAVVYAAAVETMPDGSPSGIVAHGPPNANPPGTPSFHPGYGSARGCDPAGQNCSQLLSAAENAVKPIERAVGWFRYNGPIPSGRAGGRLEGPENKLPLFDPTGGRTFELVPGSLLWKTQLAREMTDGGFAVFPAPPEPPPFYLIPGDGSVTVAWEQSPTEENGDPFWPLASDPTSPFFNPNYRRNDVQTYRIWRRIAGQDEPEVVAAFGVPDRPFVDYTCETVQPHEDVGTLRITSAGDTVAVVGYAAGEICPLGSDPEVRSPGAPNPVRGGGLVFNNGGPGRLPGGGIVRNEGSLTAAASRQDTAPRHLVGGGPLRFAWTDTDVYNNFVYEYGVTAVDLNSAYSGPISQESELYLKQATPRSDQGNLAPAEAVLSMYLAGDDGVPLEPGEIPDVDPETGIFEHAFPPAWPTGYGYGDNERYSLPIPGAVERLLGQGVTRATIDSVRIFASGNVASGTQEWPPSESCVAEFNGRVASPFGACWAVHLTTTMELGGRRTTEPGVIRGYTPWWIALGEPGQVSGSHTATRIPYDPETTEAFEVDPPPVPATVEWRVSAAQNYTAAEGAQNRRRGNYATGARWFSGDSREVDNGIQDPSALIRVGHLSEMDTVWAPIPYTPNVSGGSPVGGFAGQCFARALAFVDRAADVVWTWSGGTVTARDVTHNVDVPYHRAAGPTWGFLTTDANGNGVLDWHDFNYIERAYDIIRQVDGGDCNAYAGDRFEADGTGNRPVPLSPRPELMPTSTEGLEFPVDLENGGALPQTGTGFGLFAYGHRFIFETVALPPDGTTWTLRTYMGELEARERDDTTDPSDYRYQPDAPGGCGRPCPLPALIPGLSFVWDVDESVQVVPKWNLEDVHTVPDPYLGWSRFDARPDDRRLMFVNLPSRATIRIYSVAGHLVRQLDHADPTGGGSYVWDIRDRGGEYVASGVYFFHVITPTGDEHVGKFTIVMGNPQY